MNSEMMEALYTIEREKGISVEIMLEALANALVTAYKRMPDAAERSSLALGDREPVLCLTRVTLDADSRPFQVDVSVFRASAQRLRYEMRIG